MSVRSSRAGKPEDELREAMTEWYAAQTAKGADEQRAVNSTAKRFAVSHKTVRWLVLGEQKPTGARRSMTMSERFPDAAPGFVPWSLVYSDCKADRRERGKGPVEKWLSRDGNGDQKR